VSTGGEIRRIVVAVDTSADSLAALRAAARLAAGLSAELHGLFVEDDNVVRLARLPFARELSRAATSRPLEAAAVERQLRLLAAEARRALEREAASRRVACTFRVARGQVAREVAAAAGEGDLLILGRVSRPILPGRPSGSTARAAAREAASSVLLFPRAAALGTAVVVVYDTTPLARRALALAARLARLQEASITLLLPPLESGERAALEEEAAEALLPAGVDFTLTPLRRTGTAAVAAAVGEADGGLLVLAADTTLIAADELPALVERLTCPVLVVR